MTYNSGQELNNNELGSENVEKEVKETREEGEVLGRDERIEGKKWELLFVSEFEQMGENYPVLRIVFCDPKTNEITQTEITPVGLLYSINEYHKLSTPVCNKVELR